MAFCLSFATGVASQQGTLTLPDTWFRPPFWDLLMLQLLRPNSSNLPCLCSTFHLEYPLVLSRFYFVHVMYLNIASHLFGMQIMSKSGYNLYKFMNDFHLCTVHLNQRDQPECRTMILNKRYQFRI